MSNVLVQDNTVTGTDSSGTASASSTDLRIKSSPAGGGRVSAVGYLDNCASAVRAPLDFDTHYSNGTGPYTPDFTGIVVNGLGVTSSPDSAQSTLVGLSARHPLGLALENISTDTTRATSRYADITLDDSGLKPSGTGASTNSTTAPGAVPHCSSPPYPALRTPLRTALTRPTGTPPRPRLPRPDPTCPGPARPRLAPARQGRAGTGRDGADASGHPSPFQRPRSHGESGLA
ncbi:hypothetical protein GXW83_17595 [Streptacidiphilus sp. PB12-B1b]|nr:hypothetical protein GXW83_17595 [Streptacidiphilus sp. PB12-B1b]